jgi:hypothetical protein
MGNRVTTFSEALEYQALTGESFIVSARKSSELIRKNTNNLQARYKLNSGMSIIWIYQIVIMLIAPVLVAYWVHHKSISFQDMLIKEISSVIAMALYSLFFSWYLAMLYGCLVRGLMNGGVVCFLVDQENSDKSSRSSPEEFVNFMNDSDQKFAPKNKEEDQGRRPWGQGESRPRDSAAYEQAPDVPAPVVRQPEGDFGSEYNFSSPDSVGSRVPQPPDERSEHSDSRRPREPLGPGPVGGDIGSDEAYPPRS